MPLGTLKDMAFYIFRNKVNIWPLISTGHSSFQISHLCGGGSGDFQGQVQTPIFPAKNPAVAPRAFGFVPNALPVTHPRNI